MKKLFHAKILHQIPCHNYVTTWSKFLSFCWII